MSKFDNTKHVGVINNVRFTKAFSYTHLILWDHGGGTMTGFGYDELYEDTSLTLSSLSTALYNGGVQ